MQQNQNQECFIWSWSSYTILQEIHDNKIIKNEVIGKNINDNIQDQGPHKDNSMALSCKPQERILKGKRRQRSDNHWEHLRQEVNCINFEVEMEPMNISLVVT